MKQLLLLLLISFGLIGASYADAVCIDGWISKSSGSGTCSWHGGVKKWLNKTKSYDNDDNYYPDDNFNRDKCSKRGLRESRKDCEKRLMNMQIYRMNKLQEQFEKDKKNNQLNQILQDYFELI
jgi:hypothetical protein